MAQLLASSLLTKKGFFSDRDLGFVNKLLSNIDTGTLAGLVFNDTTIKATAFIDLTTDKITTSSNFTINNTATLTSLTQAVNLINLPVRTESEELIGRVSDVLWDWPTLALISISINGDNRQSQRVLERQRIIAISKNLIVVADSNAPVLNWSTAPVTQ